MGLLFLTSSSSLLAYPEVYVDSLLAQTRRVTRGAPPLRRGIGCPGPFPWCSNGRSLADEGALHHALAIHLVHGMGATYAAMGMLVLLLSLASLKLRLVGLLALQGWSALQLSALSAQPELLTPREQSKRCGFHATLMVVGAVVLVHSLSPGARDKLDAALRRILAPQSTRI